MNCLPYALALCVLAASSTASAEAPRLAPELRLDTERPPRPAPPRRRYRLHYADRMQLPPGADVIKRRRALVAGIGFGLFMIPNVATWAYLGVSHRESGSAPDYMVVPVVGPFIGIARRQDELEVMAASVSSAMQIVGLTVFSVGLVRFRSITYWAEARAPVTWAVLPRVSRTDLGLDLAACF